MTLFDNLKIMAKKHGMSLLQINEKAGLGKNAIYKWRTQKPSTENLQKVAKVLHTSTDYLLGNTDDSSPVSKDHHAVDIENDELLSYRGRPIPDDYLDIIKNLMDSDIEHGRKR
ncbi:XRE family transcriptional regulator [Lactobacillus sp. ESL0236]|uniref:helix-turn-helix domain-containing protein n=1 Tax=unclassified Lactobacillus TaxID=2620435 RepID=UPI000EFD38D1|nr:MULTISPECIES: helix-turn-helix transcriptional regulator [unclassified Lactobacillus]MCO6528723.1 helix-turn-helix transcriptional regulator [Lactobacillus sp.]RMC36013.1 XRE family transcriptional regulator [Lactobacillus sp. ESL0237]RMC42486.1 XRE family transcriptional regulator [Lactobacillus sp. ESL0234]RMC43505.1 XRE family transcriptional regulator [Lactobacillus sp. ESL0236]